MNATNRIRRNGATTAAPAQSKSKKLAAPAEFKTIRLRECPVDNPVIDTPPQIVDFWRKHVPAAPWFKDDKECLCVFMLNARHNLIGFELGSQGTGDTLLMNPREVLRPAIIHNAAAIIIAHNHPSGKPSPSKEDVAATHILIRAAKHLKIDFLDHIIIGDPRREHSYNSLRALGHFHDDDLVRESPRSPELLEAIEVIAAANNDVFALMHLISFSIDYQAANGSWTEEFANKMSVGISQLVREKADFLDDSVSGAFGALKRAAEAK